MVTNEIKSCPEGRDFFIGKSRKLAFRAFDGKKIPMAFAKGRRILFLRTEHNLDHEVIHIYDNHTLSILHPYFIHTLSFVLSRHKITIQINK
jgi:hypothetical protein